MKSYLSLTLVLLTGLAGCYPALKITNNGPNPIEVTANPSPSTPQLPVEIAVGENAVLTWSFALSQTTNLMIHDTVLTNNFDAKQLGVPGDATLLVEWNGTQIVVPMQ